MENDPQYIKMLEKSHIMRKYHQENRNIPVPQIEKQPKIINKVIATSILSTITHILVYPLDTIKVRKMAKSTFHDVARFQQNKVPQLSSYLGFFRGLISILIGNICFQTVGQQKLYLAIILEGVLKTFPDMHKISAQMGNSNTNFDITKKTFALCAGFSILRDLTSRSTYLFLIKFLMDKNKQWIQQDNNRKYHFCYLSAIFATVISHPFDVVFTKIASQRSMKYIGIIDTLKTIVKEEGIKKLASGIEFRLLYTLSSTMIMGSFQDNFIKLTLQVF